MVGADEQRPGAGNVFDSSDLEKAHKVDVDHRPHEPTQERINHFARSALRFRILSTTWSTSRSSVSVTIASAAGRSGAIARCVSTPSRSSTSFPMPPPPTRPPPPSYYPAPRLTLSHTL